jgi:diguanylate cyclase (GGDEF)-like protein
MKKSFFFSFLGFLLGTGAPLGILVARLILTPLPLSEFFHREWAEHDFFYLYMLLGTCLVFSMFGLIVGRDEDRLLKKNKSLSTEVLTDPLTGLGNHRFLHDTFKIEFRRHLSSHEPISCLMLDLDHFKRINDTYGHPFGDYVLRHFAVILKKNIREGDTAARYGGEEFLGILPNCDKDQAYRVAERIRKATERHLFLHKNKRVQLTVSLGAVTSYDSSGLNYRQLIALSDRALYEAKGKGRNQVVQASLFASGKSLGKKRKRNPRR